MPDKSLTTKDEEINQSLSTTTSDGGYAGDQSNRQQQEHDWASMILNSPKMQAQQARANEITNSPKVKADQALATQLQQGKATATGLPEELKLRMEAKYKVSLDDVEVYYNSSKPAEFGALAYAIGNKIYIGPGQEKHLEQELAHVVQQKLGLVKGKSKDQVNIDPTAESKALNMVDQAPSVPVEEKAPEQYPTVQPQQEVMQLQGDDELIQQLDALSRGEQLKGVNTSDLEQDAVASANKKMKGITGSDDFAGGIVDDVLRKVNSGFRYISKGYESAVDGVQKSMDDEKAKNDMIRSLLFAFSGVVLAWAPLAAAHVASVEKTIAANMAKSLPQGASIKSIKIPAYAQAIKKLGNAKLPGAINSTASAVNGLIKTKPKSAKSVLNKEVAGLHQKTVAAIHASILEMSMAATSGNTSGIMDEAAKVELKKQLINELVKTVMPDYKQLILNNDYPGIMEQSKTDLLKKTIINTGEVKATTPVWGDPEETVEGNTNKDGNQVAEHAVNAIGGKEKFAASLDNPHEMAFGTLNVSLQKIGLSINTTEENKQKAAKTDYLAKAKRFSLNIDNKKVFNTFLRDQHGHRNQKFSAQSGAIKDLKDKYPMSSSFMGGKTTTHNFTFDNITVSKAFVEVHPKQLKSILDKKIVDLTSFYLEFDTAGSAKVYELTLSRSTRNFAGDYLKDEPVNGKNRGVVSA